MDGLLNLFVRVENDLVRRVVDESGGQAKTELALSGLFQLATQEPTAQPV